MGILCCIRVRENLKGFSLNLGLRKHQLEALEFLAQRESAGLFFEMGLGKTLVMLEHLQRSRAFPCLIACPLSVVSVWARESKKFGFNFTFKNLTGSYQDRIEALNGDADFYVINFEGLRIIPEALKRKGFKSMILDESHRVKDCGAAQTKVAMDLSDVIPHRYILTGTPVPKSPEDLWSQIEIIQPQALGNFWNFRARYINFKPITIYSPSGSRRIKKAVSFKNLKELQVKVSEHCLRRTKQECLSDLPDKIYKSIYCELGAQQRRQYDELKSSLAIMLSDTQKMNVPHAATLIQKLRQVCQGFIYNEKKEAIHFKENGKLVMLKDVLQDILGNEERPEKVIVFGWFQAEINLLHEELGKHYKVFLYSGDAEERGEIEKAFQEYVGPAIFLSQIEKAKEGITLTAANHVVYFSNSWSYSSRKQSEDRAHRVGQKRNVIYYDFIAPNTVDELVYDALIMKGEVADKITGDSERLGKMIINL